MNFSKLTIGLIVILLVLTGCGKAPIGQALDSLSEAEALAGQVTTLHYDVFSELPIFFINGLEDTTITPSSGVVTFTPSITTGVVHSVGYYLTKTGWKQFTFTSSDGKVKSAASQTPGNWVSTPATASVSESATNLNSETIVLAYVCVYNDPNQISAGGTALNQPISVAGWKCGCLDQAGTDCNHYMAQSFKI